MTINKTGSASYQGFGKAGRGHVSTQSGALSDQPYGFQTRFEDEAGTNPEELIAAAHASCFTMALSMALAKAGHQDGRIETMATVSLDKDGDSFQVTSSALKLTANVNGIEPAEFERIAGEAKAGCPISKLLNCEITLDHTLNG